MTQSGRPTETRITDSGQMANALIPTDYLSISREPERGKS